ncbi:MAG TPA: hypothetical protein VMT30_03830 [Candidatus Saccharimonadia bacterium]|nr:hypothetical protein [Candidatus Saccharimonadia bacterium]
MSNEQHPTNPFKDYESGGIALAGCFMVGLGAGLFVKPLWLGLTAGAVIGLGVGLLAMAWMSRDR